MPKTKSTARTTENKPFVTASPVLAQADVPSEAAKAFAKLEPEIEALDADDLEPINIDIPRAVSIAIGATPHLQALRGPIRAALPQFPVRALDEIGTYAMAAWFAHLLALPQSVDQPIDALLEEAAPLRATLLLGAEALAAKGHFDSTAVKAIRAGRGNIDTASDLVALSTLYTTRWTAVHTKTAIELHEVQRAAEIGPQILVALGLRDQPGVKAPNPADPQQRRQRAFTLFVRAYEECRRAVTYLRWHEDDADDIAPSLWTKRNRRVATATDETADTDSPMPDTSPAPVLPPGDK